ncbi:MAG: ribonucleotide-diphosphate reductase subunit alpha [Pirellulaceae bacterium]|nr:MAG: ribonucleotide-diphosphate reductase subunit alpha [Pirellulaceae bacterium]
MAEIHLTPNALRVLHARYLRRDPETGQVTETPEGLFRRVARAVASAEAQWAENTRKWEERFYELLSSLEFLPNSPCLMNAGTPLSLLSACFVLPVEDSLEAILDAVRLMVLIQRAGGGVGFSFSRLRPAGAWVRSTGGTASGPVSFMRIFDCATENVRQGGKRRGANMGILSIEHPDIEQFIDAKRDGVSFRNFNLSVAVSDAFMEAVENDRVWHLRDPRTGQVVRQVGAQQLWHRLVEAAWQTGDPGLVFLDAVNRANPTPAVGRIEATNPCGEVPLLPYESCNLGSINLTKFVRPSEQGFQIDWQRLEATARLALRFLDDMIDVSRWPDPALAGAARANRKVGLGVMGFAELLLLLEVPYDSREAVALAEQVMATIQQAAGDESCRLAERRGVFPHWPQSVYSRKGERRRNATCTSIAPTGTIGIIAGTSAGIEPLFGLAYQRRALDGQILVEVNPVFQRHAQARGYYNEALERQLLEQGTLQTVTSVPERDRRLFKTALEIPVESHLQIQAAFQRYTDNAVSKTINLPESAGVDEVERAYRRAWQLGLKGVTVYRYGSKAAQVLELGVGQSAVEREHFARCDPHACSSL